MVNFEKLIFNMRSHDQTDDLIEVIFNFRIFLFFWKRSNYLFLLLKKKIMTKFKVNLDLAYYFGIYLIRKDEENETNLVCMCDIFGLISLSPFFIKIISIQI